YRNEVYSAKGKISAIDSIINRKNSLSELSEIFQECNLCRHCVNVCPGEIDTPALVVEYRARLNKIKTHDNYLEVLNNIKQSGNPYGLNNGYKHREGGTGVSGNKNEKILVFLGCTTRHKLPELADSLLNFLDRLGFGYTVMDNEPCCGNILYTLGYVEEAKNIAKQNKGILNKFDKIITLCPGCYNMLKTYKKSVGAGFEVFHILEVLHEARSRLKSNVKEPLYFQVPCHIYNSDDKFKNIISDITQLFEHLRSSLDVMQATKCCGAGGGMLLYNKGYVQSRVDALLRNVATESVITACPFCYLNFKRNTSKAVSFITDNLEVEEGARIELKDHSKSMRDVFRNKDDNVPVLLLKYKVRFALERLLPDKMR
ncbi:MAG: (Fe-S)-binding protein, partial [Euryarchaeota archaeon]|nr:(Fe-S)-binding protein [Euryarchaeota archaeon]